MPKVLDRPDFQEVRHRFEAWWAGSSIGGRPLVAPVHIPRHDAAPEPLYDIPREIRERDPRTQMHYVTWGLNSFLLGGDTVPSAVPFYASDMMLPAVLAGASAEYTPRTTWIHPMADVYERSLPEPSADHEVIRMLQGHLAALADCLGDRALLAAPALLDSLTTLSMLREPATLCMDLIERPQDVHRVVAHLDRLSIAAHQAFWETLCRLGHAQSVTWAGIYAPGKADMVMCDFGVMLSPAMFQEFAIPSLRRMTEYFDYSCYHLDGTEQTRFLDALCTLPRLQAIQWNPQPGAPSPIRWLDFYREVRRRKRSLWIRATSREEAVALVRELGPEGLMLSLKGIQSQEQMEDLVAELTV